MTGRPAILGIEIELPQATLDNHQLAAEFKNWTAEKILAKTGIRTRHIAGPDELASDLAVGAAKKLLARNYCAREEIDYLIYCTQSPDYLLPTTACLIQERLQLSKTCAALDFNLGCSGYIYGLGLAKALIESGQAHAVLFLTADTYSKFIHPKDQSVRTLFGDAGAATLIRAGAGPGQLPGPFVYGTDGRGEKNLIVPTRGLKQNFVNGAELITDEAGNARTVNDLFMNGPEIFSFSLKVVPDMVARLLQTAGVTLDQVDLFVFHQANLFMLEHLRKKLAVPRERFCVDMEDVGNTVSCTIPIALSRMIAAQKIKHGALVMLVGFGVGYSWGATLVRWGDEAPARGLGRKKFIMKKNFLRRFQIRLFGLLARVAPGAESVRPWLHRRRGVKISGSVFIGDDVMIETEYPECVEIHDTVSISMRAIIVAHTRGAGKVILEKNCFIGPNAVICCAVGQTLRVGEGAVVSAGSVVTRSVPAHTMVAPPPTRAIATLEVPFTSDVTMERFLSGLKLLGNRKPRR